MNDRNILLKVLKFDKNIYRDILQSADSLRLLIPLYFIYQFISYYSSKILSLSYLDNIKIFISTNSEYLGFTSDEISTLSRDIDEFVKIIDTPFGLVDLFSGTLLAIVLISIYLGIIFFGLTIKKIEVSFNDLVVLYLTSIIPKIFYVTVLFTSELGTQTILVIIFFTYSLAVRISGLKQIYFLNNRNAIIFIIWPFTLLFLLGFLSGIFA